jgi:hypothetical protein
VRDNAPVGRGGNKRIGLDKQRLPGFSELPDAAQKVDAPINRGRDFPGIVGIAFYKRD